MSNWIDDYERWVALVPSTPLFKRWAGVMALSAALQRRRWLPLRSNFLYPNLYLIFVSRPATGKTQAMDTTKQVLSYVREGVVGHLPESVTRAALIDRLAEQMHVQGTDVWSGGILMVDELSTILHEYDTDLISHLSLLWNCPPFFEESRRHADKKVSRVERPYLSIFAGVQPSVLGAILPEHAWTQGFCSRTIFVFSEEEVAFDPGVFDPNADPTANLVTAKSLGKRLERICETQAPMHLTADGRLELVHWTENKCAPYPSHEKLSDYNTRRWLQVIRLAIIRACGENRLDINAADINWGRRLLETTEHGLQQMFMELKRATDQDVYNDLTTFVNVRYTELFARGKAGVPRSEMFRFLMTRTSVNKVQAFIDGALLSGLIRLAGAENDPDPIYQPITRFGAASI